MAHKELEGLSQEDFELFKKLLTGFYGQEWEESHRLLRKQIEKRLRSKQTNETYRSELLSGIDDLVSSVVLRFATINSKLHNAGREIENFEAMLNNRIKHVYSEELRRIEKIIRDTQSLDDPDARITHTSNGIDSGVEEEEQRAVKLKCQKKCLKELPKDILNTFLEYCGRRTDTATARTEARLKLALRDANLSPSKATPEQATRAMRNLHTKICRYRKNRLLPCQKKCIEQSNFG
jgi:hypothetical protein